MVKRILSTFNNIKKIVMSISYIVQVSFKYDKLYLVYFIPQILIGTVSPFITVIFPKLIIDAITDKKSLKYIVTLAIMMFSIRLAVSVLSRFFSEICNRKITNIRTQMKLSLVKKTMLLEYEKLEMPKYLDMKARASQCIDNNYDIGVIANNISLFLSCLLTLCGYIYIIARLNFMIVALLIVVIIVNSYAKSKQAGKTHYFRTKFSSITRKLFYIIGVTWDYKYSKEIKAFGLVDWLNEKKQSYMKQTSNNSIKIFMFSTVISLLSILTSSVQQCVVYIYLIVIFFKKIITIADFSMYLSAINGFSSSLTSIMGIYVKLTETSFYLHDFIAYDKLETVYNIDMAASNNIHNKVEIEFCDVSFKYPNQDQFVLKHISLKLSQDEKLAIVGENGAGKSTFVKLIMRLYKPTEGKILLNGEDIQKMDINTYTELISCVFQDYKILALSLKENISGDNFDERRLKRAINDSGLYEKVLSLHNGIETHLSKEFDIKGIEFSGGEQQKVAIAQALYKDAPIMIFDEPTSNLSPMSEYNLYKQYNSIVKNKIAIFISHRLSSCRFCDKIAVFDNGEIAEYGTHDNLIHKNGIYADMFYTQSKYYTNLD